MNANETTNQYFVNEDEIYPVYELYSQDQFKVGSQAIKLTPDQFKDYQDALAKWNFWQNYIGDNLYKIKSSG